MTTVPYDSTLHNRRPDYLARGFVRRVQPPVGPHDKVFIDADNRTGTAIPYILFLHDDDLHVAASPFAYISYLHFGHVLAMRRTPYRFVASHDFDLLVFICSGFGLHSELPA